MAAIQSTSGNIEFDSDSDGNYELTLSSTGLGVGVSSSSISANLEVQGNTIVSDQLLVGGSSSSSSNLSIQGTFGFSTEDVSSATTMANSSYYLVDTSSSSVSMALPDASTLEGRVITVKKTSVNNELDITVSGNLTEIDGQQAITMPTGSLENVKLIAASGNWFVLSKSSGSSVGGSPVIFRSSGYNNTSALESGNVSKTMTIASVTATFTGVTLAGNIGVGDAIQYDSDGNGSIDAIAFISGRTSSTVFTVQAADGGAPTAVTSDGDWSIFRAYSGLYNFKLGTENTGIDGAVQSFDTSLNPLSMKKALHVACYADAPETLGAHTYMDFNSSFTGKTSRKYYIKLYTPYLSTEVGTSQRHSGVWDSSKFYITSSKTYGVMRMSTASCHLEGLQIDMVGNGGSNVDWAIAEFDSDIEGQFIISHNIIRRSGSYSTASKGIAIYTNNEYHNIVVYNNIIYGFQQGIGNNHNGIVLSGTFYYANNTIADCDVGISNNSYNAAHVSTYKNNLVYNSTTSDYDFASGVLPGITGINNLSSDTTATSESVGTGSKTFTFVNAGGNNFHLAGGDTGATDLGLDLSSDSIFSFNTDIDGATRSGTWDVGADEK